METQIPFRIRPNDRHTHMRKRDALAMAKTEGTALWWRANGSARLFYYEAGKLRQKTWKKTTIASWDATPVTNEES